MCVEIILNRYIRSQLDFYVNVSVHRLVERRLEHMLVKKQTHLIIDEANHGLIG